MLGFVEVKWSVLVVVLGSMESENHEHIYWCIGMFNCLPVICVVSYFIFLTKKCWFKWSARVS